MSSENTNTASSTMDKHTILEKELTQKGLNQVDISNITSVMNIINDNSLTTEYKVPVIENPIWLYSMTLLDVRIAIIIYEQKVYQGDVKLDLLATIGELLSHQDNMLIVKFNNQTWVFNLVSKTPTKQTNIYENLVNKSALTNDVALRITYCDKTMLNKIAHNPESYGILAKHKMSELLFKLYKYMIDNDYKKTLGSSDKEYLLPYAVGFFEIILQSYVEKNKDTKKEDTKEKDTKEEDYKIYFMKSWYANATDEQKQKMREIAMNKIVELDKSETDTIVNLIQFLKA